MSNIGFATSAIGRGPSGISVNVKQLIQNAQLALSNPELAYTDYEQGSNLGLLNAQDAQNGRSMYLDKTARLADIRIGDFDINYASVIVRRRKLIVTTILAGLENPVNEIVSNDLYEILLNGVIISDVGFPSNELQQFSDLCAANVAHKVKSEYLRLFDIHQVVISQYQILDTSGYDNLFAFELNLLSDTVIELEYKDGIYPQL